MVRIEALIHSLRLRLTPIKLDERGQSLVQTLVSVAIVGILVMAMTSMFNYQNQEMKALKENLAASDFQQQLTRAFKDGSVCSSLLSTRVFDSTNAVASSPSRPAIALNITSIPISTNPGAPALATADAQLSPISSSLVASPQAQTFSVTNIVGSHTTTAPGVGAYTADFQVNLNSGKLVRPIHPIATQIEMQTSGTGPMQTIVSCTIAQNPNPTCVFPTNQVNSNSTFYLSTTVPCPTGYQIMGGSGMCWTNTSNYMTGVESYQNGNGWFAYCGMGDPWGNGPNTHVRVQAVCCKFN